MNFSPARKHALLALGILCSASMAQVGAPAKAVVRTQDYRQNFNFSNTELRSAFKALAVTGKVDIVVAPTVSGSVASLQLSDKTWQEALMVLCQMFNLKYTVENNYLYVQTMAEFNKNSVENATAMHANGTLAPLLRDVIKLKNSKAKDLEESIKGLLSGRGKITVVERNNAILVFDTKQNIQEIRSALRELDVETFQVNIQSQLIQVDADALQEVGVDWQFGVGHTNALISTPGKISPTLTGNFNMTGTQSQSGQVTGSGGAGGGGTTGGPAGGTVGGVAGATSAFAFGLLNGRLAAAVANLLAEARGEVLAKPQITTIDNTEAKIFMGEQVPIKVLDANGRQAVQLQDAGTSLTVTPHVTSDGRILLDLFPEKNSFRNDPAAGVVLQKQNAKTTVLVNDGETVVIAGLTTKEETVSETGIPLLKDIPLLGWFFKHRTTQSRKRDLIIFVTPHIVKTTGSKTAMEPSQSEAAPFSSEGVYGGTSVTTPENPATSPAQAPTPASAPANSIPDPFDKP